VKNLILSLSEEEALSILYDWTLWRRPSQTPPVDLSWYVWLLLSGRGGGKTRVGSETVIQWAKDGFSPIALVGRTKADVRDIMIETGDSSILKCSPPWFMPEYKPTRRHLVWPNGVIGIIYSGDEPDQLRGPQHMKAWVDELAKFGNAQEMWDNLMMGLRIGSHPQAIVTTTPRPIPIIKKMERDPRIFITRVHTLENKDNLAPEFLQYIMERYEGTRLGRQELAGETLSDNPDALWKRENLDMLRVHEYPPLFAVVTAIDPAVTNTDASAETGIITAGIGKVANKIHAYLLKDSSLRASPQAWGTAAISDYNKFRGDRIVAEVNNGGDMVESNLLTIDSRIPVKKLHATRGKYTRAEPVSSLYEQGRVHHVGFFPELEDQLCEWVPGEKSPDRLDALVWAITELMLGEPEPIQGVMVYDAMKDFGLEGYRKMNEEFNQILKEATSSVENMLKLEDDGWINLTRGTDVTTAASRVSTVNQARTLSIKDPLAKRSVALMTDYSFGTGINWKSKEEQVNDILSALWEAPENKSVFSAKGQRKSSDKLLVDGEIFFAIFLGKDIITVRRVDPLEITEFITNSEDMEDVRYYKREWNDAQSKRHVDYYRSTSNIKDEGCQDALGASVKKTQDAFIYHLAINDLEQRGSSFLLPAIEWIQLYRRFLASRAAVMLALAKFAWKIKVQGGTAAVNAAKSAYDEKDIPAGSTQIENMGAELQQIRVDSGASQAYQDGRMLKLQVSAATGFPEQYYGDISIGNLATAKTVELPVQKMIESYQAVWADTFRDIFDFILNYHEVPEDKRYTDIDMPEVSEQEAMSIAQAISMMCTTFPQLKDSQDVLQQALITMGIQDTNEVLEQIEKIADEEPEEPEIPENPVDPADEASLAIAKALRMVREAIRKWENVKNAGAKV
jgi:phage terminase large subunit-like protein